MNLQWTRSSLVQGMLWSIPKPPLKYLGAGHVMGYSPMHWPHLPTNTCRHQAITWIKVYPLSTRWHGGSNGNNPDFNHKGKFQSHAHYCDVIMGKIASQITSLTFVYSSVYSGTKLRVTGLCAGNPPGTCEFPAQMASNAENVSIWWRHHDYNYSHTLQG